ncbi:MAG: peptide chain release factor N(5)-glutamine methyltransferase [Tissierellia bacterium]|nr:peptide chain release factor N(5)-glutamine methyltransferase [Tissierellia bacterium]
MEINQLLKTGVNMIKDREYGNPVLEATMVLEKLLNVDRIYVYTHGKAKVDKDIEDKFLEIMELRATGYPIQYILKEKEFMGLNFYIEEGVLIPRPDTEILVEYILNYIDVNYENREIKLLDIGFGSGAIGLSIAYYKRQIQVLGVDNSDIAMKVASINRDKLNLENVKLYSGDLFSKISDGEKFHIIASNPPYIPSGEIENLQREVKDFEPVEALDGGDDGLDYYREIIPNAKKYLERDGLLIFEIGWDQGQRVKEIFLKEGFKNVEILKDLQGLDRVVCGIK